MTRELQRAIQAMAVECDDTYAMANSIEDMLEEIFDDHEAQLKAKDDEIRRLNNLYADTIKDLGDALIEIEKLKEQYHQCLDDYIKCAKRKEQQ